MSWNSGTVIMEQCGGTAWNSDVGKVIVEQCGGKVEQ